MKLQFNNQKFVEQAKAIYGSDVIDECQKLNSKELLHEIFEYKCRKVDEALRTICENKVGDLMIKLFYINRKNSKRILKIVNADWESNDENAKNYAFHANSFTVYIFPSKNTTLNLVRFCHNNLNYSNEINTTDTSLFHELNHAFHCLMNRRQKDTQILDRIYENSVMKGIWGKYGRKLKGEEFYNITGLHCDKRTSAILFDPINCNMYEICKFCTTAASRKQLYQRISHKDAEDLDKFAKEHNLGIEDFVKDTDKFLIDTNVWVLSEEDGM